MTTAETFGFAAQTLGLVFATLMLAARGFRRFWASTAILCAVTMVAIVTHRPVVMWTALAAELVLIIATTARIVWPSEPWEPRQ